MAPIIPIKTGIDGIGVVLDRMAIHLARKMEEYEFKIDEFYAGKVKPFVKIDAKSGRNLVDPEVWRRGYISDLERRLKTAQRDAMQFMRCHLQHRQMEEKMGKSVTRDDKKEFLVTFFHNELTDVEQKEMLSRLSRSGQ